MGSNSSIARAVVKFNGQRKRLQYSRQVDEDEGLLGSRLGATLWAA